jgi:uncharacterized protein YdaU (DUF1376 family)
LHYYQHNIGDYRKETTHLSLLEHGIYRQLLDTYCLKEAPLTLDHAELMRTHSARSADEMRALENVLKDFFVATEEGYVHMGGDLLISDFHSKSTKAAESANARWERIRAERHANALRTQSEGNANHKPLTINQEPIKEKTRAPRFDAQAHLSSLGVGDSVIADWLTLRKTKRAPVTLTAINGVVREAEKAKTILHSVLTICCERGWAGFKAEWLNDARTSPTYTNAKEESRAAAARAFMPQTQGPRHDNRTIDITPAASLELGFADLHEDAGTLRQPVD